MYEDAELGLLLKKDASQMQEKFELIIVVTQHPISHRLKLFTMIKQ